MRVITALAAGVMLLISTVAQAAPEKTEAARIKLIQSLNWQMGGAYKLPTSKATLRVGNDYALLVGVDALRYVENINGMDFPQTLEAVIVDPKTHSYVVYQPYTDGYVKLDQWGSIDADKLLDDLKQSTIKSNKLRKGYHIPPLTILGWKEKPTYDPATHEVRWAISSMEGMDQNVNTVALIFGRYGYEKLTWVGSGDEDPAIMLAAARAAFSYDPGATYMDYKEGGPLADYDIATLVASVAGAKQEVKFEPSMFFVALAKKLWVFLLLIPAIYRKQWMRFLPRRKLDRLDMPDSPGSPQKF